MFWPYIQTDFTLIKIKIILNIYIYFCVMDTKTKYEGEYTMSVLDLFVSKFFCFFWAYISRRKFYGAISARGSISRGIPIMRIQTICGRKPMRQISMCLSWIDEKLGFFGVSQGFATITVHCGNEGRLYNCGYCPIQSHIKTFKHLGGKDHGIF